jgi:large subunit ribosomal protein L1
MGKIRVKSFGDEEQEQKDKLRAEKKAEAKKIGMQEAAEAKAKAGETVEEPKTETTEEAPKADKPSKGKAYIKTTAAKKQKHSEKYRKVATQVEKTKKYKLSEALELLEKVKYATFDETVELHINTYEKGVSGNVTLPHGTGKQTRVAIANTAVDAKHVEELVSAIEAGKIDFDVLIATPESMIKLAKVARVLGPRGLMPNPKNGTVTPKPDEAAKKFAGGQINFKTEAKFPLLHMAVGKLSFGDKKLAENIKSAVAAIKTKNIKNVTLKSTMSPGIKLDTTAL